MLQWKLDFIITHYHRHHHYHQQQPWMLPCCCCLVVFVCCYLFLLLCVFHQSKALCVFCSSLVKPKLKLKRSTDNNKGTKMARSNLGKVFSLMLLLLLPLSLEKTTDKSKKYFPFPRLCVYFAVYVCVCMLVCWIVLFCFV